MTIINLSILSTYRAVTLILLAKNGNARVIQFALAFYRAPLEEFHKKLLINFSDEKKIEERETDWQKITERKPENKR